MRRRYASNVTYPRRKQQKADGRRNDTVLALKHLSKINEVHKGRHVTESNVWEQQDWMLGRVYRLEDVLEVAGAGAQNDPVSLDGMALTG